jgi:indole-3-glycerol phosphate synthase
MTTSQVGSILDKILVQTAADLVQRKDRIPAEQLELQARNRPAALSLFSRLASSDMGIIAEIKRASPSRGRFPTEVNPSDVAQQYVAGGAAAISVLTDEPFFQGSLDDLELAANVAHAATSPTPVLRKDFIIDTYQVLEARARGADALLLIVAALDDAALTGLLGEVRRQGLEAMVEVHDEAELARASAVGASIIGINNRDLRTFAVDLAITERLAPLAPDNVIVVSESGIFTADDVERVRQAGARGVLVGESLITAPDRSEAVRALRS